MAALHEDLRDFPKEFWCISSYTFVTVQMFRIDDVRRYGADVSVSSTPFHMSYDFRDNQT